MTSNKIHAVAAAVAGILAATSASALDIGPTNSASIKLVFSGASAARDSFASLVQTTFCQADFNRYNTDDATVGVTDPDFRAYSCTLKTGSPDITDSIEGQTAVIYYRSEGGSVYGPGAVANNVQIKRINVATGCQTTGTNRTCPILGYDLSTDTATNSTHIVADTTDVAISDVEPTQHIGEQWPDVSALGAEPTIAALTLDSQTLFGQPFGVMVNSANPIASLSKQDIVAIWTGTYGTWDQVPGSTLTGNITVCSREEGSGTRASFGIYMLGQGCSTSTYGSAPGSLFGNPSVINSTTSAMEACVAASPNAIGYNIHKATAPAGTKYVNLNGAAPSEINAATGAYDFWFEATASKRPGLGGDPLLLANDMIAAARKAASLPDGGSSAIAITNGGTNLPTLALATGSKPLALGTRNGNSCAAQQGVN